MLREEAKRRGRRRERYICQVLKLLPYWFFLVVGWWSGYTVVSQFVSRPVGRGPTAVEL